MTKTPRSAEETSKELIQWLCKNAEPVRIAGRIQIELAHKIAAAIREAQQGAKNVMKSSNQSMENVKHLNLQWPTEDEIEKALKDGVTLAPSQPRAVSEDTMRFIKELSVRNMVTGEPTLYEAERLAAREFFNHYFDFESRTLMIEAKHKYKAARAAVDELAARGEHGK